jgi:hypothetical protein
MRVDADLTIFPDMIAAVKVTRPRLMMVHDWLVIAVLPIGGELIVGRFPCQMGNEISEAAAETQARELHDKIVDAMEHNDG